MEIEVCTSPKILQKIFNLVYNIVPTICIYIAIRLDARKSFNMTNFVRLNMSAINNLYQMYKHDLLYLIGVLLFKS